MLYKSAELINYLLISLYMSYIGIEISNPQKRISKKRIISTLILLISLILINKYFTNIFNVYLTYLTYIIYYKINYKNKTNLSLYTISISTILIIISKSIITLFFKNYYLKILLTILLTFILTILLKKPIKLFSYNNIITKNMNLINYLFLTSILIYFINEMIITKKTIQNIIIFIILATLTILVIIQEQKIERLKLNNQELIKYSKSNEKTVTDYRKLHHENKNKLIIIKNMINPTNQELKKYVNYLINEQNKIKNKWLNELRYIPLPEIKNFLNYKINILEKLNANIELFISEQLSNLNPKDFDVIDINKINTIIGVLIDNIIEAIQLSKEKIVSINIYIHNKTINIILANNFENKIDLNKIDNLGYSTKGKRRGIGLSLVKDIIKSTKNLELETKIEETFFIQHLKIKNIIK